jgi:3-keto-5-aminohexanoate cleavage enzyme
MSSKRRKVIVAVAPVGKGITPGTVNPLSPDAVAEAVVACARAGAAMVHLHVRDRQGRQTEDLADFSRTLDRIRTKSDIIIQGSTGGDGDLTLEQRCVALNDPRVEVASLNMGSVNFGETVYVNTLPDVRYWSGRMRESSVVPEVEVFEAGMIAAAFRLIDEGAIVPPFYFNFCLGFHHALPATPESLFFLRAMLPAGHRWGFIHDGMRDLSLLAAAVGLGAACVRVGFEDSLSPAPGETARTNAELVERLVVLIRAAGCEIATPAEARQMLGVLKTP